eukprot:766673-Hanusia_phi.AAC.1
MLRQDNVGSTRSVSDFNTEAVLFLSYCALTATTCERSAVKCQSYCATAQRPCDSSMCLTWAVRSCTDPDMGFSEYGIKGHAGEESASTLKAFASHRSWRVVLVGSAMFCLCLYTALSASPAARRSELKASGMPNFQTDAQTAIALKGTLQTSKQKYDSAKTKVDFLQGKVKVIEKELSKEVTLCFHI